MLSFLLAGLLLEVSAATQQILAPPVVFDVQGHRGGRGNAVENTLPSFAWGLIHGATTLELDNGITKDGAVVVWHDEQIVASKCQDTRPAFPADPAFPYVGQFIANLTLAQIKTLDCGSQRQKDFPLQLTYPSTRISTLQQVFDFVQCVDPEHTIQWNIESKIDPVFPNRTASVDTFVKKQHEIFVASPYRESITFQSFDWRSLIAMKELDPTVITSALIDHESTLPVANGLSPWLGGLDLNDFPGSSLGIRIANAAHSINASILSPSAYEIAPTPALAAADMVRRSHQLGMLVKPWTVNRLDIADELLRFGVDGIITDYPDVVRRWAQQQGMSVSPKFPKRRVLSCLEEHSRE